MFVPFLLLDGVAILIDSNLVTALEIVPLDLLPPLVPAGTYVTQVNAERTPIQGTIVAVALALQGAPPAGQAADAGYVPNFAATGGGVVGAVGLWRGLRIGTRCVVQGSLSFQPSVPGVNETVSFTIPPPSDTTFRPALAFANTFDLSGGIAHADPLTTTDEPQAKIGNFAGEVNIICAGAAETFWLSYSYDAP